MIDYTKEIEAFDSAYRENKFRYMGTIKRRNAFEHVVAMDNGECEIIHFLDDDGRDCNWSHPVIRNVAERRGGWFNCYGSDLCRFGYDTKTLADAGQSQGRTACIYVEWKDGDGL
jgi:hypothetical protein